MRFRSGRKHIPRRADIWPRAYRRHPITAAIMVLLVALVLWQRSCAPAGTDYDRYHNKTFTCVRVVDGDTLDIDAPDGKKDRTRIRLWGVDTPETDKSPQGAGYFGAEASAFARQMVEGKRVRIVLVASHERDRYERLLAYVYLADGEAMLNEELLAQGYAYADHRFDHPWKEHFADLEKAARKKKLGLWEKVTPDQYPAWRQRYERKRTEKTQPATSPQQFTRPWRASKGLRRDGFFVMYGLTRRRGEGAMGRATERRSDGGMERWGESPFSPESVSSLTSFFGIPTLPSCLITRASTECCRAHLC